MHFFFKALKALLPSQHAHLFRIYLFRSFPTTLNPGDFAERADPSLVLKYEIRPKPNPVMVSIECAKSRG